MTRIDFYHDAADPTQTAARLVQKAFGRSHRIVVLVPDAEQIAELDRLLWLHPATGFLPHCRAESSLAAETPVLLASSLKGLDEDDILINLGTQVPDGFSRFGRLIEIIGQATNNRIPGRERYRHYRDAGHTVNSHALTESNQSE